MSRSLRSEKWDFNEIMQIMKQEVDARECSFTPTQQTQQPPKNPPPCGTATALNTDNATINCAFCDQDHQSHSRLQVTDVKARKELSGNLKDAIFVHGKATSIDNVIILLLWQL